MTMSDTRPWFCKQDDKALARTVELWQRALRTQFSRRWGAHFRAVLSEYDIACTELEGRSNERRRPG